MKGLPKFDSDEVTETVDEVEGHKKGLPKVDGDDSDEVEGHRYQKQ
jgi:uncharacterized protein YjbJ (UPF0337 family)